MIQHIPSNLETQLTSSMAGSRCSNAVRSTTPHSRFGCFPLSWHQSHTSSSHVAAKMVPITPGWYPFSATHPGEEERLFPNSPTRISSGPRWPRLGHMTVLQSRQEGESVRNKESEACGLYLRERWFSQRKIDGCQEDKNNRPTDFDCKNLPAKNWRVSEPGPPPTAHLPLSVLVRVLQRRRTNGMKISLSLHLYLERERYHRNWLTQLWMLRSYKICSQQARDPEKPMVSFQFKSKGLRTRGLMVSILV